MHLDRYARLPDSALAHKELTPAAKLVLLVIHKHAWGKKTMAWPSEKRIGEECNLSVRCVRDSLKKLVATGYLTVEHRKNNTSVYHLTEANNPTPSGKSRSKDEASPADELNKSTKKRNNQKYALAGRVSARSPRIINEFEE